MNRLGRAYMELGEYKEAEGAYRKTLAIDQYNAIAQKNLQRLTYLKKLKLRRIPKRINWNRSNLSKKSARPASCS